MTCTICNQGTVKQVLDLGNLAITNRYLTVQGEESTFAYKLGICDHCAGLHLMTPYPETEIEPKVDWIKYNEPEDHLDRATDIIHDLVGKTSARIMGLTYKDDTLLDRLAKKGHNTYRIDAESDLGGAPNKMGVETVQRIITVQNAQQIAQRKGKADVLLVRHVLEHVYDFSKFFDSLRELVADNGLVLFEVPDYTTPFKVLDYTTLWEDHLIHFTPFTYNAFFQSRDLTVVKYWKEDYVLENCLMALVSLKGESKPVEKATEEERALVESFCSSFEDKKQELASSLQELNKSGPVGVFGAGHTTGILLDAMKLKDHIAYCIDDNEHKKGLFVPGSQIPIVGSEVLSENKVAHCLFSLNVAYEEKIMAKFTAFTGTFGSLSPVSKQSIWKN